MSSIVYLNTQRNGESPKGNRLGESHKGKGEVCNIYRVIPLPVRVQHDSYPLCLVRSLPITNPRKPIPSMTIVDSSQLGIDRHLSNVDRCHGKGHLRLVASNCVEPVKAGHPSKRPGPGWGWGQESASSRVDVGIPSTQVSFLSAPPFPESVAPKKYKPHVALLDSRESEGEGYPGTLLGGRWLKKNNAPVGFPYA